MSEETPKTKGAMEFTGERFIPEIEGQIALEHLHRYALALLLAEGKQVLDIASGEGYGSNLLAKVAANVIGVDISEEAISHAKAKYIGDNLEFRAGSATNIPVESHSIDLVVSFETIEHLAQHDEMLTEIKRVSKPDGILIISSPNKQNYSVNPNYKNRYHVKELLREEFEILLKKYFRNCHFLGQRIAYGSLIFPYGIKQGRATYFELNQSHEIKLSAVPSMYEVAIASNADWNMIESSFLNQEIEKSEIVKSLYVSLAERENTILTLKDKIDDQENQLSTIKQELIGRNKQIAALNQIIVERDGWIKELKQTITERDHLIQNLSVTVSDLFNSTSWKITKPLRFTKKCLTHGLRQDFRR